MEFSYAAVFFACCVCLAELKPLELNPQSNQIVLVRLKRDPNRAFTFSGFNPNTGLSAFATSADFLPSFYRYAAPPSPPSPGFPVEGRGESYLPSADSDSTYNYPPSVEQPSVENEDRKIPPQNLTPPADTSLNTGYNVNANAVQTPKKPKKKPNRVNPAPVEEEEDAEENDAGSGKSRSSSSASFNAWFPIVLGSYPSSRSNPESYKDAENLPVKERPGSNVIANSVSNGRSGVASSHAILYGGESPMQSYRRG